MCLYNFNISYLNISYFNLILILYLNFNCNLNHNFNLILILYLNLILILILSHFAHISKAQCVHLNLKYLKVTNYTIHFTYNLLMV